ncbi:hypothetical protein [Flavobacterium collinsii]|uniref:Uncharacterized protein n=1 Tax=Flavobacterium collinsii TaxID=1114861 RepID=A0A9W4THG0_9FLAO|nr:hypothetical protein [Flavobacterium collinsii]CAA9203406.1 hypothetical protein FLACOL7796_04730 [Flavobacterium collinsii]CAI2767613.1 conserved protein of unknown function [Flavobacterium collinsii]
MQYIIRNRIDNEGKMYRVDIDFIPENLSLSAFFSQINLIYYPDFIIDIYSSSSTGYEYISLRMFSDIDWEDQLWIKSVMGRELCLGEIFLHHEFMGDNIISESLFDKILYDYSIKILDTYKEDNNLNNDYINWYQDENGKKNLHWKKDMIHSLSKLSQKIALEKK